MPFAANRLMLLAAVVLSPAAFSCVLSDSTPRSATKSGVHIVPEAKDRVRCLVEAVIEDGENRDHQVRKHDGRNGYIYTFGDKGLSSVQPPRGATFSMTPGGASGSGYAARINGQVGGEGLVYAGLGINMVDPRAPYDASKYEGVAFWARRGPGTSEKVRVKLPDINTDEQGGVCTECFNAFGVDITVSEWWDYYVVPFKAMSQMAGWGDPRPPSIDAARIYTIQFQVSEPGKKFDIWVDDLVFLGCP